MEIAHALAVPVSLLERWAHQESWARLAPKIPVVATEARHDKAAKLLERIEANREKNLTIAQKLQEDLLETVQRLRDGKMKTTRTFANGTVSQTELSLRDRCDLALYARNVAELSYRALGDIIDYQKPPGSEPSAGPQVSQITIILPPAVASPRQERALAVNSSYDVDTEVVKPEELGPDNRAINDGIVSTDDASATTTTD